MQREAVVGRDEIDRGERAPPAAVEQIRRPHQARSELGQLPLIATPEGATSVAVPVVPFRPARWKAADLVTAGAAVPGLGNQLHLAEHRILAAGVEKATALVEAMGFAAKD